MILDILEYSIKALHISYNELENGAVTAQRVWVVSETTTGHSTVSCQLWMIAPSYHGSSSRYLSNSGWKLPSSTLHDVHFYRAWAQAIILHCWWRPLPVTVSGPPHGVWACALSGCYARSCTNKIYNYIYTASGFLCIRGSLRLAPKSLSKITLKESKIPKLSGGACPQTPLGGLCINATHRIRGGWPRIMIRIKLQSTRVSSSGGGQGGSFPPPKNLTFNLIKHHDIIQNLKITPLFHHH